jgi:NHL repeat
MPIGKTGDQPGQFQVPAAIAIDKFNRIIVADQMNQRIQVFRYVTDDEAAQEKAKLGIKDDPKTQAAAIMSPKK